MILDHPTGSYPVGATTFTLPVRPTEVVGTAGLRTKTGQIASALQLEEVCFTAYYPASPAPVKSRSQWLNWLPRPLADSVRGYSRFTGISEVILWPIVFLFGSRIQVPAFQNVSPLRRNVSPSVDPVPDTMDRSNSQTSWPLVIFSHGLGGDSTTYSQLCTHLASTGRVVLAMEHRDGTCPVSRPRSEKTGEQSSLLYIRSNEVVWADSSHVGVFKDPRLTFRGEQLEFRRREIYLAYSSFRKLVLTGERGDLRTLDDSPIDWESWAGGLVQCDEGVSLVGHSFGGATVFSILSEPSPKREDVSHIPVSHSLVLDPWLEPLASPGPEPFTELHSESKLHKTMIINSEAFTLWKDHFRRLEGVVPTWPESTLVTVVGARHISFSDFPILIPIRRITARLITNVIKTLSSSFLDDTLPKVICDLNTRQPEIKHDRSWFWARKVKQRLVGQPGDIVIHRWGFDSDVDTQAKTDMGNK